MIHVDLFMPDLDPIIHEVESRRDSLLNLAPVAEELASIVENEAIAQRLAGSDKDGVDLAPIKPATVRRRRQMGKGDGPPLLPDSPDGRVISGFRHATSRVGATYWEVVFGWEMPWVEYHAQGLGRYGKIAVRDIGGLPRQSWQLVAARFRDAIEEHLNRRG